MTCKEVFFPTTGTDKKAMDERCPLLVLASVSNMICGTLTVILGLIQMGTIPPSGLIVLGLWGVCCGLLYVFNGIVSFSLLPKTKLITLALSMMCIICSLVAMILYAVHEFSNLYHRGYFVGFTLGAGLSGMAFSNNIFAALLIKLQKHPAMVQHHQEEVKPK